MIPLIKITFIEGMRSRILYGIFIFSLLVVALSVVFSSFFMQNLGKVAFDFNISAISLSGLLISVSLSVNLLSKDFDRKTVYFVLSRPITRNSYILGKYFGILSVLFVSYFILCIVSCSVMYGLSIYYEKYFKSFEWLCYAQAVYFDFLKVLLLNSIIIFFGVVSSSSFINLLFTVSVYIAGQSVSDVVSFITLKGADYAVSDGVENFIQIVKYVIPNLELFDFKVLSANGIFIPFSDFISCTAYALCYSAIILLLSVQIFSKKDLL